MKILNIDLDIDYLQDKQQELSDLNKALLYDLDKDIFNRINFEADAFFLEPSLFFFLLDQKKDKLISLEQLYAGIQFGGIPAQIDVYFDQNGVTGIPMIGEYHLQKLKNKKIAGIFDPSTKALSIDDATLQPTSFLFPNVSSNIRLPFYTPEIILSQGTVLEERIVDAYKKSERELNKALLFYREHLPDFFEILALLTKEIYIFNSKNTNSFAGITCHGAAFLNTEGKEQDYIFFIDDIAHQCGHIIFNTLTLDYVNYINIPKETQLKDISPDSTEKRKVYGAFHGLFTYSCIIYSLSKCIDEIKDPEKAVLLTGRIGFYLIKFSIDINFFSKNTQVFNEKGLALFQQFKEYFEDLCVCFHAKMKDFDYRNQPYTFDERSFIAINKSHFPNEK